VHISTAGQYIMICCTLFPIAAITLLCLTRISLNNLYPFMPHGPASVIQAARIVIFSFFGFECAGSLFKIMQKPEKNIGKAFVYSIGIVALIYLLFTGSMIGAFGAKLINTHPTVLLETLYPTHTLLIRCIDLSIISAIIGTVHAMLWSASYLFHFLIQESSHSGNAWIAQPQKNALLLAILIAVPLLTISLFGLFFNLTALVVVSAYMLCMLGLIIIPTQRSFISIIGILTGFIILFVALQGTIQSLIL
jgi:amino acid transporter